MHQIVCNVKMPKMPRAITWEVFFRIFSKVNKVIYSLLPIYSSNFKALAWIVFETFCWQDFIHFFFSKGHNSGKGHNPDKKKNMCWLFCHEKSKKKKKNMLLVLIRSIFCTKTCCEYSLEAYPQSMFLCRNKENIYMIPPLISSYDCK